MPRKDRDVWDPPEDRKPVEKESSSAFLQHFQSRAVRVGKDGSNAQLVRVKQVKPIKWTEGGKNGAGMPPCSNNVARTAVQLPRKHRMQYGGILPPEELCERAPLQQRQHVNSRSNNLAVGLPKPARPLNVANLERRSMVESTLPFTETPQSTPGTVQNAAKAAVTPRRPAEPNAPRLSDGGMRSSDVASAVCRMNGSTPLASFPFMSSPSSVVEALGTLDVQRRPLGRLLPRSINTEGKQLMPRPLLRTQTPSPDLETPDGNGKDKMDDNDGGQMLAARTGSSLFFKHGVDDGDANLETPPIPLYQPMGLFLPAPSSTLEREHKTRKFSATKKCSAGGGAGEKGRPCMRDASSTTRYSCSNRETPNSAPPPMSISHSGQLEPLPRQNQQKSASMSAVTGIRPRHRDGKDVASDGDRNDENNDDDGGDERREKKKLITYKPHGLKEYRRMMNDVAGLKLGGLGPADTDEQREARKKMLRQRKYGELVERQVVEEIREKRQQHQGGASDAAPSDGPAIRQNPPPLERIQAQGRRVRALEYARNLPRPSPSSTAKRRAGSHSPSSDSRSTQWCSPQDEAARRREKHLLELEARHNTDRECVAAVKRQLGY